MTVWTGYTKHCQQSISVNKIPLLIHFPFLSLSEWQLCFSCHDQLNLAPVNKHGGAEMEMSSPSSGPHRRCTIPTFSKSQILSAFSTCNKTSYFDLAFCLGAATAMDPGFGAGAGAGEDLTESYRLRHLRQNTGVTSLDTIQKRWKRTETRLCFLSMNSVERAGYLQVFDFLYKSFDGSNHPPYPHLSPEWQMGQWIQSPRK